MADLNMAHWAIRAGANALFAEQTPAKSNPAERIKTTAGNRASELINNTLNADKNALYRTRSQSEVLSA